MNRIVEVSHGEAFQLMLYRSEDRSAEFWIWNSRDGVTPFGDTIKGQLVRHAMHGYPTRFTSILPDEAQFVWVTHTPETWKAMQERVYQRHASSPDDQPYGGADFRAQFPSLDDWHKVNPFEYGAPHRLTREEYLATTPEYIGGQSR